MNVGGVRRWSVALLSRAGGDATVMLVQYFAEEAAPGLPNEGHGPTERGSVARLSEQLGGGDVGWLVMVMMMMLMSVRRQAGWADW